MSILPLYEKVVFFAQWRPFMQEQMRSNIETEIAALRQLERLWLENGAMYDPKMLGDFIEDGVPLEQVEVGAWSNRSPLSVRRRKESWIVDGEDILEFIPLPGSLKPSRAYWWSQFSDSVEDITRANRILRNLHEDGLGWVESQAVKSVRANAPRTAEAFPRQYAFLYHFIAVRDEDSGEDYVQSAYIEEANIRCANEGFTPMSPSSAKKLLRRLATVPTNNRSI